MSRNLNNIAVLSALLFVSGSLLANIASKAPVEFRFAHEKRQTKDEIAMVAKSTQETLFVDPASVFSSKDFSSCELTWSKENGWLLSAKVGPAEKKRFNELTGNNVGKRLGVLADGVLWNAPVIKQAINAGPGIIVSFQGMDKQQAQTLSAKLSESCRK